MPSKTKKRGKIRWVGAVQFQGVRKYKWFPDDSRASEKAALKWESEELERLKKEAENEKAVMGWCNLEWGEEYLDDVQARMSKATYGEKHSVFRRWVQFSGADLPVEEITPALFGRYMREQAKERSGNAVNKDRKNLVAAWNWARVNCDDWPNMPSPFKTVEPMPSESNPRYVPPVDDFWAVVDSVEGQDRAMLLTFLYTAARRAEVFALKVQDLDFAAGRICLWTRKRRQGALEYDYIPMIDELRRVLIEWLNIRPIKTEHLFCILEVADNREDLIGQPFRYRQKFMSRACETAKVRPFGFHAIRHLSATVMFRAGVGIESIQAILRHKSQATTERYLHSLGLDRIKEKMEGAFSRGEVIEIKELAEKKKKI